MEELKKCIREAGQFMDKVAGILDADGMIIACTDEKLEGTEDSSARAVLLSDESIAITYGRTYVKLPISERTRYIIFVDGADTVARVYIELLSNW
ncbi:MAG: hypothetical protein PHP40_00865, partial [Eubacteriales bacterium]|nr:hypothetical protein [Eubacteriales bacterium]